MRVRVLALGHRGRKRGSYGSYPEVLTPVLRVIHRVIAGSLLKQAGLKRATADTGALTLIQRFGSAANLNIHLHCLVFDGVYRRTEGDPVFQQACAPTRHELKGLLEKIIARLLKRLTRLGYLVQEEGMTYLADIDPDNPLTPLQAASCTYRIAETWSTQRADLHSYVTDSGWVCRNCAVFSHVSMCASVASY